LLTFCSIELNQEGRWTPPIVSFCHSCAIRAIVGRRPAKTLRVARGTVQNRLGRMEKDGTIVGYTVKLKPQAEDQTDSRLDDRGRRGYRTDEVLRALRGDPAVCALHTTNGRWDIVAELRTDSLEAVDQVLSEFA